MTTILEALTEPDVGVDASACPRGRNSAVKSPFDFQNWTPWTDFTYDNLTQTFAEELGGPYFGSPTPQPLHKDLTINDEPTFQTLTDK